PLIESFERRLCPIGEFGVNGLILVLDDVSLGGHADNKIQARVLGVGFHEFERLFIKELERITTGLRTCEAFGNFFERHEMQTPSELTGQMGKYAPISQIINLFIACCLARAIKSLQAIALAGEHPIFRGGPGAITGRSGFHTYEGLAMTL